MLQFVVLYHEMNPGGDRASHWDLMLEDVGVLLTWALPRCPSDEPQECDRIADHRTAYLNYEGPVSQDRGTVIRWDRGTFVWESRTPSKFCVRLHGEVLAGLLVLSQTEESWKYEFLSASTKDP